MQRFATALLTSAMFLPTLGDPASAQHVRSERLLGGNENPPVISDGSGRFTARLRENRIPFRLRYDFSEETQVLQAHLHIANPGVNGGIVVWLCANPPVMPPEGVTPPACPSPSGEVSGDIVEDDVRQVPEGVSPEEAIIEAGDLDGLKRLIEQSSVYANVHTADHMGGEIRGQMEPRRR